MKRGFTLHEVLMAMLVLGLVLGMVIRASVAQLRSNLGVAEISAVRGRLADAALITSSALWDASPGAGDVVAALDSALELRLSTGSAIVCGGTAGRLIIPAPRDSGSALSAFSSPPQADDAVAALVDDSLGPAWLGLRVARASSPAGACEAPWDTLPTWAVELQQPVLLPVGSLLRFSRPMRFSLYRASDGKWFLGARDWNGDLQRYNAIQPVAGPLRGYSTDAAASGLVFRYFDVSGAALDQPIDVSRIAAIGIIARAATARPITVGALDPSGRQSEDSIAAIVALRNAR